MLNYFYWADFTDTSIDDGWEIMSNRIKHVTDILCPIKTFQFTHEKPSWLTNDIMLLIKERDQA